MNMHVITKVPTLTVDHWHCQLILFTLWPLLSFYFLSLFPPHAYTRTHIHTHTHTHTHCRTSDTESKLLLDESYDNLTLEISSPNSTMDFNDIDVDDALRPSPPSADMPAAIITETGTSPLSPQKHNNSIHPWMLNWQARTTSRPCLSWEHQDRQRPFQISQYVAI